MCSFKQGLQNECPQPNLVKVRSELRQFKHITFFSFISLISGGTEAPASIFNISRLSLIFSSSLEMFHLQYPHKIRYSFGLEAVFSSRWIPARLASITLDMLST